MKKLGNAIIAIGIVCLMSACSNDDYYAAMHAVYPLKELVAWILTGMACISFGSLLKTIKLKG